jgi:hypothetical protein
MSLSEEDTRFYQQTLERARRRISEIDELIERELAEATRRISELQNQRNAARQMYEAACTMLGVPSDLPRENTAETENVKGSP